jgi:cytochrome c oxidase subunit 2
MSRVVQSVKLSKLWFLFPLLVAAWLACEVAGVDAAPVCTPMGGAQLQSTSILTPISPPAREIHSLAALVVAICAAIFLVVEGALVWAIIRYRRPAGERGEPVQVFGSNPIELAWTVIPLVIVFVLSLATVRTIQDVQRTEPPEGALEVDVIGHQWWWEYRIAHADGAGSVVMANELVVPVGRPVWLRLASADVIHSWWVPALNGKTDVVPGRFSNTWFEAEKAGTYLGQCAEYCGTQHANMLLRVRAVDAAAFESWRRAQAAPARVDPAFAAGRDVFLRLACMNCHAIDGSSSGAFGPNLTHLMSRETLAAGMAPLNRDTLRSWLIDPQQLKPGCNMPSLQLTNTELDALVDYLSSLH